MEIRRSSRSTHENNRKVGVARRVHRRYHVDKQTCTHPECQRHMSPGKSIHAQSSLWLNWLMLNSANKFEKTPAAAGLIVVYGIVAFASWQMQVFPKTDAL
jgi:hypothetical protein